MTYFLAVNEVEHSLIVPKGTFQQSFSIIFTYVVFEILNVYENTDRQPLRNAEVQVHMKLH